MDRKTKIINMEANKEDVSKTHLPQEIPVFPLNGLLLLPGMWLPLHFFEHRYCNMVGDALKGDGYIGVIQPLHGVGKIGEKEKPGGISHMFEEEGDTAIEEENSTALEQPLYRVGCLGWIAEKKETKEGHYLVALQGLRRFAVSKEIPPKDGYRRLQVNFSSFMQDGYELEAKLDLKQLLKELEEFAEWNNLQMQFDQLDQLPPAIIVNGLSMSLPFHPSEKQGLLEAPSIKARLEKLISLMKMGQATSDPEPKTLIN